MCAVKIYKVATNLSLIPFFRCRRTIPTCTTTLSDEEVVKNSVPNSLHVLRWEHVYRVNNAYEIPKSSKGGTLIHFILIKLSKVKDFS